VLSLRLAPLAAWAIVGCGRAPTPTECNALLDRYVHKLVESDRPGLSAGELLKLQVEARARAGKDPAFGECSSRVSRSAYECAMRAETLDRMEICLN
jgi:hypothetical protein